MGSGTVLVIGGTGGQGVPIVEYLSQNDYHLRVLTRNASSKNAKRLAALGSNVEFSIGSPDNEDELRAAFSGVDYAFVNLNTWALGIKNELYWGIRIFELAVQAGVKHYIWSTLDNYQVETRYDDDVRVVHYYGKSYVEQWMQAVPQSVMKWSFVCTGPYIEQLWSVQHPKKLDSGVYDFLLPLNDGAIPYTCLDDLGHYVRWILENPEKSSGLNLKVAVEHVSHKQLASVFTEVTGKPAKATNITSAEWFNQNGWEQFLDLKIGAASSLPEDPSLLTVRQNFTNWWKLYQQSGSNKGLLQRDYALLDEIYPGRTRSLKQWMERVGYDGDERRNYTVDTPWGSG
ncbi:hypothetical protein BP5796_03779 [Coleophoma crateriformis]|uniref:NmrA-like domain-containing protein n=1 Tax=Coleophoma crateriformis TaxID=565419 RepID=A0A3D8SH30_9HELO|nr:hypothetical protein BP5796_03779 [Coleophoma crateriformis]